MSEPLYRPPDGRPLAADLLPCLRDVWKEILGNTESEEKDTVEPEGS